MIPGGHLVPAINAATRAWFGLPEHPVIVGLFEGYGGLTMGVQHVTGGSLAAYAEIEPNSIKLLEQHFPGVPNLGDVSTIDWSLITGEHSIIGRVHILLGGFPCQDVSVAGLGAGLRPGTRSGLWYEFARAIAATRPNLVVIENVAGLRSTKAGASAEEADNDEHDYDDLDEVLRDLESGEEDLGSPARPDRPVLRAFGAVLLDLAALGYDARWTSVRASNVGAPHRRERVFIIAWPRRSAPDA